MKNYLRLVALSATMVFASATAFTSVPAFAEDVATPTVAASQHADAGAIATNAAQTIQEDKISVENPYGLDALWKGGDFVARGTLLILVIMSIGSWYVIVTKLYEQLKINKQAKAANETFWTAGALPQALESLDVGSAYHFLAKSGIDATEHHGGLLGNIDFNTWVSQSIQRSIDNIQSRLQDGLAFLGTVGSTAPFVGLFGTVWGIYHALTAIGIAGQASIDKVAGPVGEALIMTAIGLGVAVPAVLGYNWLVRRNKSALDNIRAFGADLHAVLLSSGSSDSVISLVRSKTGTTSISQVKIATSSAG